MVYTSTLKYIGYLPMFFEYLKVNFDCYKVKSVYLNILYAFKIFGIDIQLKKKTQFNLVEFALHLPSKKGVFLECSLHNFIF